MCYLRIQTNLPVSRAAETTVVNEATVLLARELVRPPSDIVIAIEADARLFLAGNDDPAAFIELKLRSVPPHGPLLGEALGDLVHQHLGVPEPRVCVKFVVAANAGSTLPVPA